MRTPTHLNEAVPHILNDVLLLRQADEYQSLKVSWTAWYLMARNIAAFLELVQGRKGDMRARDFFIPASAELRQWQQAIDTRNAEKPAAVSNLYAEASQAAAHLSWKRVTAPRVQKPSTEVTTFLCHFFWGGFITAVPQPYKGLFLEEWNRLHGRPRGGAR